MFSSSKFTGARRRRLALVSLSATLFAALTVAALAAHWPQYGGDAGRSGYQPVNEPALPIVHKYSKTADTEKNIRTSIITTAPGGGQARMIYGTDNPDPGRARIHLQALQSGNPVGLEAGIPIDDIGDDPDSFGGTARGSVTPVDTSTASQFGNVFALHNDDNQNFATTDPRRGGDVALAQILTETGQKGQSIGTNGDIALGDQADPSKANTINFTINSSPVLAPDDGSGNRTIYFTAVRASVIVNQNEFPCAPGVNFEAAPPQGNENLRGCEIPERRSIFKVTIAEADDENATVIGFEMSPNIANLNTDASPTLANLDPDGDGTSDLYVVVPTTNGFVRTHKASDLTAGPSSADMGDDAETVSVPVNPDGTTPAKAPALFVAVREAGNGAGVDDTIVYRLTVKEDADPTKQLLEFDPATGRSFDLPGQPSTGLSVSKEAGQPAPGRVVVLTSAGVHSLNSDNLRSGTSRIPATAPAHTRVAPATSGDLAFWTDDKGEQHVADIRSLEDVPVSAFQPQAANDPATGNGSWGQPSIAFRFAQFASDEGAFVYEGQTSVAPPGSVAVAVSDVTVKEGDAGTSVATFTLTKTGSGAGGVSVQTADGTAKAGEDYVAVTARGIAFGANETTKTVDVTINGDKTFESDEFFKLQLSNPSASVVITDSEGSGIIQNDDAAPDNGGGGGGGTTTTETAAVLIVSDAVVTETDTQNVNATFTVSLTSPAKGAVTVRYATVDKTATAGSDYTAASGQLTFAPGETTKTFTVAVRPDVLREDAEQFVVGLANATGAAIADANGTGTIVDDDAPPAAPFAKAPSISLTVTPKRDKVKPFRFTSTGTLSVPAGVTRSKACQGRVEVQVKVVRKTISTRRANVDSNCRYRIRVTFKDAKRFSRSGVISFRARYMGTPFLKAAKSKEIKTRTTR